ncbi:hypothetical protein TEA_025371 [Camellia sinensis var. sinensis]|uniref:TFIIS central domain-containing protein n=1 Tax=Camellia sinensis var. sinensis TaxID=542762 RepID=A0A4S4CVH0_CAMSN|nr:hypothetical protein TEA_025371 [Camellia sinensis var. sinensis]
MKLAKVAQPKQRYRLSIFPLTPFKGIDSTKISEAPLPTLSSTSFTSLQWEGLTAEEIASKEPEESERMQMTDARCKRCSEKKVGLIDIIQAGLGDRYQLECIACGNTWYASRDEASTLTIDGPSSARSVGTAPWATAKFEDVEKKLVSPRESEKSTSDVFKKTTEAYMPVLDTQKSFNKPSRTEDNTTITKDAE